MPIIYYLLQLYATIFNSRQLLDDSTRLEGVGRGPVMVAEVA
jgi:hypothetical protein